MAQSSYGMHVNRALQKIAARFKNDIAPENVTQIGPVPEFMNEFTKQVDVDSNVSDNQGPNAIIDVQPDYRNIILAINFYITREYPEINVKPYPALTPAALMAYYLALFYAHALLSDDINIRQVQSRHAHAFQTSRLLDGPLAAIRNFPVPPFIVEMLQGLQRGIDDRKTRLFYVNSFACYDLLLDYGRTPPISVYLSAHNITASKQANTPVIELTDEWMNTTILQQPIELKVANYFGVYHENQLFMNWFYHPNATLINPVTNRYHTTRPTLMPQPLAPQNLGNDSATINPYVHLLCLDDSNVVTVMQALTSVSRCVKATYPSSVPLGSLVKPTSNSLIMNHYYSNYMLPTWHKETIKVDKARTTINANTFASATGFKKPITKSPSILLTAPNSTSMELQLYLATASKFVSTNNKYIQSSVFSNITDINGDIRHFCPFETSTECIQSNIVIGRHIEVEEITSSAVPQPNPENDIIKENSFFLESAIPISNIKFINSPDEPAVQIAKTHVHTSRRPAVRMDLFDRSIDRLPQFPDMIHVALPPELPGYNRTENIPDVRFGCNSVAFTIRNGSNETVLSPIRRKLIAWSSYRYYNTQQYATVTERNRKLLLVNFRTLHGTNVTLVETPHPAICIPMD